MVTVQIRIGYAVIRNCSLIARRVMGIGVQLRMRQSFIVGVRVNYDWSTTTLLLVLMD